VQFAVLVKKLQRILAVRTADPKELVPEMTKYLESKGKRIGPGDAQMAMQIGQILEITKNEKAAGEALKTFAKLFAQADDAKVAQGAKLLEGMARRLTLLGNEMAVKGKTLEGKAFDLKELKGKVVLVDFWATWCGPCVGEIPNMKKMYTRYNKQGFEIIGISLDDSVDDLKKFIAKEEMPWASIHDGDPRQGGGLADHYGVVSIPLAILIGRDGRVVTLNARGAELTRLLEEIFDEKK
jgi:thiol-disulfide isomerase/thioredoxin